MQFLIVDDHAMIREGLRRTLEVEFPGADIAVAATAAEAQAAVEPLISQIVILDLSLTGRDGFELLRDIKERSSQARVLIHTMHTEEQFGVRALRAGADGYLTKDRPVEELLTALRRLHAGKRYISDNLAERLADVVTRGGEAVAPQDTLSDREHQILRMIVSGKSPTEIANELSLSIKTISTYRARMLEKLDLHTTADLIRFGLERNLA
jgi:two-component system invasion response regulator UvrY